MYMETKKKNDQEVQNFLKFYVEPPLQRLDQKIAVRGGLNELFACFFSLNNNLDQCFFYGDMNSSYPFHACGNLPLGEYKVIY